MEEKNSLRVFIAEDEPLVLLGIKKMVQCCGHRVVGSAMNGRQAVESCIKLRPDILLIDINMPELDGIAAIKKINESIDVPAVVITGYTDSSMVDQANSAKVYGYLQKPVDEIEIRNSLKIAMGRFCETSALKGERDEAVQSLKDRKIIERAKGIIQTRFGISEEASMKSLIKKARNENKKLVDAAKAVIEADKLL